MKNMNDVSVVDAIDTNNDTSIKKVTWNEHGPHSTYSDNNDKTDISENITSVNKTYKYKSYKDACSNNSITHRSNTITHGATPLPPPVSSE